MTEMEIRQQKAILLLECQEAEQTLAHLREKSRRLAQSLERIASWLRSGCGIDFAFGPAAPLHDKGEYVRILEDSRYETAMDFPAAKKLAEEIKDALSNLQSLKE